ncbi:MAG TPA: hypothetical protein VE360_13890, partial [Pyrinomonadaceae bacterium]|nr:hypothetical protein [Pyrinomonadaceae bacterium]
FTLPVTTGTRPGVADYLPAPHGLPGFAAPVEQVYPAFASFVELADGRVLATADGADAIKVEEGGRRVRAFWRRWAVVGGKSGEPAEPGITSEVAWTFNGQTLSREEAFTASAPVTLRRWWFAVPTTAARHRVRFEGGRRELFESHEGTLEVRSSVDWPHDVSLAAPGDGALGRGARGAVPLHLNYEARDVRLHAGGAALWLISVKAEGKGR